MVPYILYCFNAIAIYHILSYRAANAQLYNSYYSEHSTKCRMRERERDGEREAERKRARERKNERKTKRIINLITNKSEIYTATTTTITAATNGYKMLKRRIKMVRK